MLTLITDPTIRLSIRNEDAVKSIRQIKTGRVEKGETVEFPFWVNETHRCDVWQALYTSDSVMLLAGYVTYNASNTNCIVFYAELIDDEWRAGKCYYKTRDERVIHEEMSEEVALRHIAELRAASK
ncbi:MAG TPA: hypothetical protein VD907_05755 [Verrucomicrobiae bacterium]|nr:hypothetical protein [Verrucomicrobiae bacterium]